MAPLRRIASLTARRLAGVALLGLCCGGVRPAVAGAPVRIVSMNLCTDQLALLLVDKRRIASVSFLGADPAESPLAGLAAGLPINHGQAEEVIAQKPDLVLTGRYTTGFSKAMLRRLGFSVLEVESPRTIPGIRDVMMVVADALEAVPRAEQLLTDMDRRLRTVATAAAQRPRRSALIYDANGFTVGRPGVTDDIMTIAGLDNLAPSLGIGEYGTLPLETILATHVDRIVHLVYRPGVPSLADAVMDHPALKVRTRGQPMMTVRGSLLNCATPMVAEAAEVLSASLDRAP